MQTEDIARDLVREIYAEFQKQGTLLINYGPSLEAIARRYIEKALTAQAEEIERLRGELRRIAEGNLGDAPWQANYEKIRDVASAALKAAQEVKA